MTERDDEWIRERLQLYPTRSLAAAAERLAQRQARLGWIARQRRDRERLDALRRAREADADAVDEWWDALDLEAVDAGRGELPAAERHAPLDPEGGAAPELDDALLAEQRGAATAAAERATPKLDPERRLSRTERRALNQATHSQERAWSPERRERARAAQRKGQPVQAARRASRGE